MRDLNSLKHIVRKTPGGAEVIVLDTGAVLTAEDVAMLQAMHSRSSRGVRGHLEALAKRGSGSFMDTYYVGYGDKSIGDCGTTTIFIEGVSMLVAKAIQDWDLYSGQEASTRYITFENQPFLNPHGTEMGRKVLERWRTFYMKVMPILVDSLMKRFPRKDGEDEKVYEKAIRARAFDIARGFLPAGATTNLAWHTNLRQVADSLMRLRHHPLEEVRQVAEAMEDALKEAHPHSFNHRRYEETEDYNARWMERFYYHNPSQWNDYIRNFDRFNKGMLLGYEEVLRSRPHKTMVPRELGDCGLMDFDFLLDFASFRDIQRHRAVYQRMPLLTSRFGFEEWYLEEMPETLRNEAQDLIRDQVATINHTEPEDVSTPLIDQYYYPMGLKVPCRVSGDLPSLVWLMELRSTAFVHPTLRKRAIQMIRSIELELGEYGLVIHADPDPHRFDVGRGKHDIVMK